MNLSLILAWWWWCWQQAQHSTTTAFTTPPLPAPAAIARKRTITTTTTTTTSSELRYNPLELETAEARRERMELVRGLQRSFYANETSISPPQHGVFSGLPIWTDDYTELPGFQRVMNVTDPELVNMILKIVSAPRPWYYGHIQDEGDNYYDDDNDDEADPAIGTLMQISDYQIDSDDGCLRIGVQALGRFCTVGTDHLLFGRHHHHRRTQNRYASVELLPDTELVEAHYSQAKRVAASYDFALNQNARGAACAGAVAEAAEWHAREFEPFHLVVVEQQQQQQDEGWVDAVAKLNPHVDVPLTNSTVTKAMEDYLSQSPDTMYQGECFLNFDRDDDEDDDDEKDEEDRMFFLDQTLSLERDVWIKLDVLSQRLRYIDPKSNTKSPLPCQMLALLPQPPSQPWPKAFSLSNYNQQMKNLYSLVIRKQQQQQQQQDKPPSKELSLGCSSNLDAMETSRDYPVLRRSGRLSYMVWVLLEDLLKEHSDLFTKEKLMFSAQDILEMTSISQRLYAANRKLEEINCVLQEVLDPE